MDSKYIVNSDQTFGEETKSPDFEPNIKVTFALDVSANTRQKIQELQKKGESEDNIEAVARLLFESYVRDWNFYVNDNEKLELTIENMDKYLSARVNSWVMEEIKGLFT